MKILILARNVNVTHRYFDTQQGKMIEQTFNPLKEAQKLGVKAIPMPEDVGLYERTVKGEKKTVFMHELGSYALAPMDENGHFLNEYGGNRLNRVQFITHQQLVELVQIFANNRTSK